MCVCASVCVCVCIRALTDGGAHGGDVVRLEVIDELVEHSDAFLRRERHFVVLRAQVLRHLHPEHRTCVSCAAALFV